MTDDNGPDYAPETLFLTLLISALVVFGAWII